MHHASSVLFIGAVLLGLIGCSASGGLTIVNSSNESILVTGLADGPVSILPSETHRVETSVQKLKLTAAVGEERKEFNLPEAPPQSEALWNIAGQACFIHADYTSYYKDPLNQPAAIRVIELLGSETTIWSSKGPIAAAPGFRLPKRLRGNSVEALVRVPCDVIASPDVARGWLEMTLDELQPTG